MSFFDGLKEGAKIVGVILLLAISAYALSMMGLILVGILANVVLAGTIAVPAATNTTVGTQLTAFNTLTGTLTSPYTTIGALIIVAVLLAIFFKKGGIAGQSTGVN